MDYANTSTPELENLLRRPDTLPAQQQMIKAELDRRYTEQFLGSSASPPSGFPPPPGPIASSPPSTPLTASPPVPPSAAFPAQQPAWHPSPAGPPPSRQLGGPPPINTPPGPPVKKGASKLAGWLITLVVVVAIAVLYAIYQSAQSPEPTTGTVCFVFNRGTCPLAAALPIGASCTCTDGFTVDVGVVR